jgi:GNAT superfamily N-acetyltransferase
MPTPLTYRRARPEDAAECVTLRGRTRENAVSAARLREIGITAESWGEDTRSGALPGHLCLADGAIAGYCFGAKATGEVVVLALRPEFENRGVGRHLLSLVMNELRGFGFNRLFLGCSKDPASRSHGFYRRLGWRSTGSFDGGGDEILEFVFDAPAPPPAGATLD